MTSNLDPAALEAATRAYLRELDIDPDLPHGLKPNGEIWWKVEAPRIAKAIRAYLDTLSHAGEEEPGTPAAQWRVEGKPDPHGKHYGIDVERSRLCRGDLTDDALANEVYLNPSIGNLTAAKERIRWLSRQLTDAKPRPDTAEGERNKEMARRFDRLVSGLAEQQAMNDDWWRKETVAIAAFIRSKPAPQAEGVSEAIGTHVSVEYDGFAGTVIGAYKTREGKEGWVVQQHGTKVVHVYGQSRVTVEALAGAQE